MRKVTFEDVVARAQAVHGDRYQYKELVREGVYVKLRAACAVHGEFLQTVSNHLLGKGCVDCGGRKAHTLEKVKELAKAKHGDRYEYLKLERGSTPKLTLRCPAHGEFTQDMYNHLAGKGCRACFEESLRCDAEKLVNDTYQGKYTFVREAEYNDFGQRQVTLLCQEHGEYTTDLNSVKQGYQCKNCADSLRGESLRWKFDEFLEAVKPVHGDKFSYEGLELRERPWDGKPVSYINAYCHEHGPFSQVVANHLRGQGCPTCRQSRAATEFVEFLRQYTEVEEEAALCDDTRRRWDAYLPKYGLAFEFNGTYWHSDKFRSSTYHRDKFNAAMVRGVRTVTIYEDEWAEKRQIVEKLILSLLGKQSQALYARKLSMAIPDAQQARAFFTANHIQGMPSGSRYVGLTDGKEFQAMLAYAMRETGRGQGLSESHAEITRYATSSRVVGGFTKLLKKLQTLEPGLQKLTTFSDIRMFTGSMYAKCGFVNTQKLPPDYFYLRGGRRYHKANAQKDRLAHPDHEKSYTELELAEFNGLQRVYDCGKLRWELTL